MQGINCKRTPIALLTLLMLMWIAGGTQAQTPVSNRSIHQGIYFPPGYQAPGKATASILNWNIENFVDGYDDPYINNEREDKPPTEMKEKEALLIQVIKEKNPDILVLQEFETAKYLQALAEVHWKEQGYRYFAEAPSLNWFQNVVVMSKFPLGIMQSYGGLYTNVQGSSTREGQPETQALVNNRMWALDVFPNENLHFTLVAVHLKAGRTDRDIAMRKGQMDFLQGQFERWTKENKMVNILAMGDFNCTPDSEELALLTQAKKRSRLHDVLPRDAEGFTHSTSNPNRRIDHVLVNRRLLPRIREVYVARNLMRMDLMQKQSDHFPIWMEIDLN